VKKTGKRSWFKPLAFLLAIFAVALVTTYVGGRLTMFVSYKPLNSSHAGIEKCQTCHEPMKEVRPINCVRAGCHTSSFFRKRMKPTDSPLVQHIQHKDCMKCHTEHLGENGNITIPFSHLDYEKSGQCADCHMLPDSHKDTGGEDCAECHTSQTFKTDK